MSWTTRLSRGAAALALSLTALGAYAGPYSNMYVFGDSLSDPGNDLLLTGEVPDEATKARVAEETSRIEVEDHHLLVITNIPKTREMNTYDTLPLGIVLSAQHIVTVCLEENEVLGDFNVRTSSERPVLVFYYGYTNCPDICLGVLTDIASAMNRLSDADRARGGDLPGHRDLEAVFAVDQQAQCAAGPGLTDRKSVV